eukprot:4525225-Lingulodinium_polyedra.AAC.1
MFLRGPQPQPFWSCLPENVFRWRAAGAAAGPGLHHDPEVHRAGQRRGWPDLQALSVGVRICQPPRLVDAAGLLLR